jgi:hypothetical protein
MNRGQLTAVDEEVWALVNGLRQRAGARPLPTAPVHYCLDLLEGLEPLRPSQ